MRALTVRQPWAWAIIHGGKDVENRGRNIAGSYRGPVAIHAGLVADDIDFEHPMSGLIHSPCPSARSADHNTHSCAWCQTIEPRRWADRGHVIGVVDLVNVHEAAECWRKPWKWETADPVHGDHCSPWAMADHWHLALTNPRPLPRPIPARGRLGLWTLPADIAELVAA